jgi:hypothetical protein
MHSEHDSTTFSCGHLEIPGILPTSTRMLRNPPIGNIAYVCECGKKWVFSKAVAAGKPAQHPCKCGRTIVVKNSLIYGIPADQ